MSAPPKMRAASPSSSVAAAASQANRDWELDRIRRLLYEQECSELKGRLEEKETEIETIRQEKTRITKVCADVDVCTFNRSVDQKKRRIPVKSIELVPN
jgi:hypothetical protein